MIAGGRLLLFAAAAADRAALGPELARLRARGPDDRIQAIRSRAHAGAGPARVAIVAPEHDFDTSLDLAIARIPAVAGPRFVARAQGVYFADGASPGRVAFLFPGQGSEHEGMLRGLYDRVAPVRAWFDSLDRASMDAGEPPLTPLIFSASEGDEPGSPRRGIHDMERGSQLGCTAALAMHDVLQALGIRADVHAGHSNGEHPAVVAAGMVEGDRDALCRFFVRAAREGARLGPPAVPEQLLAVSMVPRETLAELLGRHPGSLFTAMDNCPNQLVIGGLAAAAEAVMRDITARGGVALPLPFARAYHTPLFADWARVFAAEYAQWPLQPGRVPVYTCLTAAPLPTDARGIRQAMADQWTARVEFRALVEGLHASGVRTFVEVGPDSRLTAFVEDTLRGRPHLAVSASSRRRDDFDHLAHVIAELFVSGLDLDPRALAALEGAGLGADHARGATQAIAADVHQRLIALAQANLARAGTRRGQAAVVRRRFARDTDPFVDDHALGRAVPGRAGRPLPVLPFTLSLELVADAARRLTGRAPAAIVDSRASRFLALDAGGLLVDIDAAFDGRDARVTLIEHGSAVPMPAFEASVSWQAEPALRIARDPQAAAPSIWDARTFYERYAFHGPGFQGLSKVTAVGPFGVEADLAITANPGLHPGTVQIDPAMLDCAGQLVAFWLLERQRREPAFGIFPFAMRRLAVRRAPLDPGATVRCRGEVTFDGAVTVASFVFETTEGLPIAEMTGLSQRLVTFPSWLASRIFGRADAPAEGAAGSAADRELLASSWGIWERAIAHLCLGPGEFRKWQTISDGSRRLDWLLSRPAIAADCRHDTTADISQ